MPGAAETFRAVATAAALANARTCYDHLAGRLGVAVTAAMTDRGLLDQDSGCTLTAAGSDWLERALRIDVEALGRGRRPLTRTCIDWTERRPHLAGAAGAAICTRFHDNGWVRRIASGRALLVTPTGQSALRDLLEIASATSSSASGTGAARAPRTPPRRARARRGSGSVEMNEWPRTATSCSPSAR